MIVCPMCGSRRCTNTFRDALDPASDRFSCHSCGHVFKRYDKPKTDANLVTAAPDLLAALTRLLDCPDLNLDELDEMTVAAIDNARVAIAKARGK